MKSHKTVGYRAHLRETECQNKSGQPTELPKTRTYGCQDKSVPTNAKIMKITAVISGMYPTSELAARAPRIGTLRPAMSSESFTFNSSREFANAGYHTDPRL